MKKKIPSFISGIFAGLLISTLSIVAIASSGFYTIEVAPINVMVDGNVFQPKDVNGNNVEVFVYNGTTYAPLRALAEAYGLEVGYDSVNKIATVNKPSSTSVSSSEQATAPIKQINLCDMTYEEFRDCLELYNEIGTKLTEYTGWAMMYHYHFKITGNMSIEDIKNEWEKFLNTNGKPYIKRLHNEYSNLVPYNVAVLHIEYFLEGHSVYSEILHGGYDYEDWPD